MLESRLFPGTQDIDTHVPPLLPLIAVFCWTSSSLCLTSLGSVRVETMGDNNGESDLPVLTLTLVMQFDLPFYLGKFMYICSIHTCLISSLRQSVSHFSDSV